MTKYRKDKQLVVHYLSSAISQNYLNWNLPSFSPHFFPKSITRRVNKVHDIVTWPCQDKPEPPQVVELSLDGADVHLSPGPLWVRLRVRVGLCIETHVTQSNIKSFDPVIIQCQVLTNLLPNSGLWIEFQGVSNTYLSAVNTEFLVKRIQNALYAFCEIN